MQHHITQVSEKNLHNLRIIAHGNYLIWYYIVYNNIWCVIILQVKFLQSDWLSGRTYETVYTMGKLPLMRPQ